MKRRAIFSEAFTAAVADAPLVLVDVGARGAIQEPWASIDRRALHVIGFEPDVTECERLNASAHPGERYLPVALWDRQGRLRLHVTEFPDCSSVHPPNHELIRRYRPEHWRPRETRAVV
jgi:hypothetical protein